MSRIGKKPIFLPQGVTVTQEGDVVTVRGPKGELSMELRPEVGLLIDLNQVRVLEKIKTKSSRAFWGTTRSVLDNFVAGVYKGFEKRLEIQGLGYRANLEENTLVLLLGYAHPVRLEAPTGVRFKVEKNIITVSGADKALVGNVAASLRALKKPEPYKGKGIRYEGEIVRKKAGKKAVAAAK